MNEKNMLLTPFSIIEKLTNPYAFSRTNKDTLNAKSELYFHDIAFVPLFMQVGFDIVLGMDPLTCWTYHSAVELIPTGALPENRPGRAEQVLRAGKAPEELGIDQQSRRLDIGRRSGGSHDKRVSQPLRTICRCPCMAGADRAVASNSGVCCPCMQSLQRSHPLSTHTVVCGPQAVAALVHGVLPSLSMSLS